MADPPVDQNLNCYMRANEVLTTEADSTQRIRNTNYLISAAGASGMAIPHIRAFIVTLLISAVPTICLAGTESNVSERPWIDFSKFPLDSRVSLDANELMSSKITEISASRSTKLFIFVRRAAGNGGVADFVNIVRPISPIGVSVDRPQNEEKVAAIVGKADVQLGNGRLFRTFSVEGPLSICYVTPERLSCENGVHREVVDTP